MAERHVSRSKIMTDCSEITLTPNLKADDSTLPSEVSDCPADLALIADMILSPIARNADIARSYGNQTFSEPKPSSFDAMTAMAKIVEKAGRGGLTLASHTLACQSVTLDSIFTEFARRAAISMDINVEVAERYIRLALKAQTNCRTTLEALARLDPPRERLVRHVHVSDGGQAIVATEFHHHPTGVPHGKTDDQPHAKCALCSTVPGPDALGNAMPFASSAGEPTVPDARR